MALEIERKFLVDTSRLPQLDSGARIRQGYISIASHAVVRVRTYGNEAFLTIKGATQGTTRAEYEHPIPVTEADEMLDNLCLQPKIEKVRHTITVATHIWELDVFSGENAGLIVAEIELKSENDPFEKPFWATTEVSADPRYRNSSLIEHPYSRW